MLVAATTVRTGLPVRGWGSRWRVGCCPRSSRSGMPGDAGRQPAVQPPPGRQPGAGQLAGQLTVGGASPGDHRAPGIVPAAVCGSAAAGRPGPHRAPGRRRGADPPGCRPARRPAVLPPPPAPGPGWQRRPAVRAPPAVLGHATRPPLPACPAESRQAFHSTIQQGRRNPAYAGSPRRRSSAETHTGRPTARSARRGRCSSGTKSHGKEPSLDRLA